MLIRYRGTPDSPELASMPPDMPGMLVVGDTHGFQNCISAIAARAKQVRKAFELDPAKPLAIVQVGDFGFWPHALKFMSSLDKMMSRRDVNAVMFFIDGNHEDHFSLAAQNVKSATKSCGDIGIHERLLWLPRGTRWTWAAREFAAVGGAVSIDFADRIEGVSWFREETLTAADHRRFVTDGRKVDVLFCHDSPAVHPPWIEESKKAFPWVTNESHCTANRMTLDDMASDCAPKIAIHGHWHIRHSYRVTTADRTHSYQAEALSMTNRNGSMGWLDLKTLQLCDFAPVAKWRPGDGFD